MIDAVRMALTALRAREAPPAGELSVVEITGAEPAMLAIDSDRRSHLLLRVADPGAETRPHVDIATLDVDVRALVIGGRRTEFIDVTCLFESASEVFDHFVVAVLERLRGSAESPARVLTAVVERWRQFLTPAPAPLGRGRLASVFGELLVLLDVILSDPDRRIDCWVGPFGGRHDLRRAGTAVEVKTTRAHTSHAVTIHGEDQMVAPDGGTLHLHLVRLEEVADGGRSVASVVDELLSHGVAAERLFAALSAASLPPTELAATEAVTFEQRERLTLPIDDETPRITRESFVGGARPTGVIDLTYVIDLDHTLDRALDSRAYTALISSLATGA